MAETFYNPKRKKETEDSKNFPAQFHGVYSKYEDMDFSGHNKIYNFPKGVTLIVEQKGNLQMSIGMSDDTDEKTWNRLREKTKKTIENFTGFNLEFIGDI